MAVSQTGSVLFAGDLSTVDDLFISTLDEMDKDTENLIDIHDPVWEHMKEHGGIEYRSGRGLNVPVHLVVKDNPTIKHYTHYDDADNTPSDAMDQAKAAYGNVAGVQMYSREELEVNQGEEQLLDLVRVKREQLETGLNNEVANHLMTSTVADGRKPDSLGAVVTQDVALHGIDPTVTGQDWWQPVRTYKTGTTAFALATEFRLGVRKFHRALTLYDRSPKLLYVAGEDVYDEFQEWAEGKVEMNIRDLQDSRNWGDGNTFPVRGTTVVYSPQLAAKEMWGLNLKTTKIRVPRSSNFTFTPWQMLEGKVAAKKRNCLFSYAVYCRDRRCNGRIVYS